MILEQVNSFQNPRCSMNTLVTSKAISSSRIPASRFCLARRSLCTAQVLQINHNHFPCTAASVQIAHHRKLNTMAPEETPMAEYRQLGKSGLRVSVPIFGAMSFGDKRWANWVIDEDEVCLCSYFSRLFPRLKANVIGVAPIESRIRPRSKHLGHSQCLQQR